MDKDYLKRLEEVAKMAKYDYMDLSDILPENNNNLSNTIRYRDLMEESAANELLKNTGVSVPDIKTANRDQIEKFANDLLQENYGSDFKPNIVIGTENSYNPKTRTITINEDAIKQNNLQKTVSNLMHEAGHEYDKKSGLWVAPSKVEIDKLTPARKQALKEVGANSLQYSKHVPQEVMAEISQIGHHASIPERMKSFGRSALENLVKGKAFRSLAIPAAVGTGVALSSGDAQAGLEGAVETILPIGTDPTTSGSAKGSPEYKLESNQPLTSEDMDTLNYDDNQRSQEIDRQLRNNSVFKDEVKNAPNKLDMLNKLKGLNLG